MVFTKIQKGLLVFNVLYILFFSITFFKNKNYEFLIYTFFILAIILLIVSIQNKVKFPTSLLVALTIYSVMHMLGGHFIIQGEPLYGFEIIPGILGFDKIIHFYGIFICVIGVYYIFRKKLIKIKKEKTLSFLFLSFSGIGIGTFWEILEYVNVLSLPATGVGMYLNTMEDIIANTLAAFLAAGYLVYFKNRKKTISKI
jgi:uncharacterized membrane protein YjdF